MLFTLQVLALRGYGLGVGSIFSLKFLGLGPREFGGWASESRLLGRRFRVEGLGSTPEP